MFEKASKLKLRFVSSKGYLTVEDLWELPLTSRNDRPNLDDIAKELFKDLKESDDVSFVHKDKKSDSVKQLKFDIVKHIIDVRLAENEARDNARLNAEKKQKILAIIADREDDALRGTSLDELKAMVDQLN